MRNKELIKRFGEPVNHSRESVLHTTEQLAADLAYCKTRCLDPAEYQRFVGDLIALLTAELSPSEYQSELSNVWASAQDQILLDAKE